MDFQCLVFLFLLNIFLYFNSYGHTFAASCFFHLSPTPFFFDLAGGVDRGMWNVLYLFLNHKQFEAIFQWGDPGVARVVDGVDS